MSVKLIGFAANSLQDFAFRLFQAYNQTHFMSALSADG